MNLRTLAFAGVAACFKDLPSASDSAEMAYLKRHQAVVSSWEGDWQTALSRYIMDPAHEDQPLLDLAKRCTLTQSELMAVVLAMAVEDDLMAGRALAYIQSPVGKSRPSLGLIAAAFGEAGKNGNGNSTVYTLANGQAVRSGLLILSGAGAPLPEQYASIPTYLCLALGGNEANFPGTTVGLGEILNVSLPMTLLDEIQHRAQSLQETDGNSMSASLVLRTNSRAEGRSVAAAMADALHKRPLFIETDQVGGLSPWLILRELLPVFCVEMAPGEHKLIPSLPLYDGPTLVLCGSDGSVDTVSGTALSWSIPVPSRMERQRLWEQALRNGHAKSLSIQGEAAPEGPSSLPLAADLAHYHRHGSGRIAHLGRMAHQHSRLGGRDHVEKADIVAASWMGESGNLDSLAQPLMDPVPDEAVITTTALRRDLDLLLLRCRNRDDLVIGLGASTTTRYHPGVRALFVGPSGTGKTLAAGWLATQLGLPLYRVDLAAVSSKYIGETEKNLAMLLSRAEQSEVILLFDEADSLFGKRTDIKEANDRFANAQTNYLLQRIETYDGITLLTSNSRGRFDSAFARRLDLIVDFPLPGPDERRRLWESHLGNGHALAPRMINQLALAADLTGGNIRNVVLTAAVLAQDAGRKIEWEDIKHGLDTEYNKLGRQVPVELKQS